MLWHLLDDTWNTPRGIVLMPKKREEIYLSAFWSDMRRKLFKVDEILFFDLFCSDIFCSSSIILVCPGRSSLSQWVGHKIQRIGAFGISKWILLYSVLVWLISNFKIFFSLVHVYIRDVYLYSFSLFFMSTKGISTFVHKFILGKGSKKKMSLLVVFYY